MPFLSDATEWSSVGRHLPSVVCLRSPRLGKEGGRHFLFACFAPYDNPKCIMEKANSETGHQTLVDTHKSLATVATQWTPERKHEQWSDAIFTTAECASCET
jgi:hypothetical protein